MPGSHPSGDEQRSLPAYTWWGRIPQTLVYARIPQGACRRQLLHPLPQCWFSRPEARSKNQHLTIFPVHSDGGAPKANFKKKIKFNWHITNVLSEVQTGWLSQLVLTTVGPDHRHGATCPSPVLRMNHWCPIRTHGTGQCLHPALVSCRPTFYLRGTSLMVLPDPHIGSHTS